MEEQIKQLEEKVQILEKLLFRFVKNDKYYFDKHIVFADGMNIAISTATGTKIGTSGGSSGQKIGFFNATPVVQQTGVAVSAAGIHAALVNLGLITS